MTDSKIQATRLILSFRGPRTPLKLDAKQIDREFTL